MKRQAKTQLNFIQSFSIGLACAVGLSSCASSPKRVDTVAGSLPKVELKAPVELKLKADPNTELVMYMSKTRTENNVRGQKADEQNEETKFITETKFAPLENGMIGMSVTTADKDGKLELRQLAMPEFGQYIRFVLAPNGKVLDVAKVAKNSIFFVSPISLPSQPVSVGDTWTSAETWVSGDGTPMVMDQVSILRGVVTCGSDQCADIDVSGDVDVQGGLQQANFKSHFAGRILFAINTGTILWSRSDSLETLQSEAATTTVRSCLESLLVQPAALKLSTMSAPICDPAQALSEVK